MSRLQSCENWLGAIKDLRRDYRAFLGADSPQKAEKCVESAQKALGMYDRALLPQCDLHSLHNDVCKRLRDFSKQGKSTDLEPLIAILLARAQQACRLAVKNKKREGSSTSWQDQLGKLKRQIMADGHVIAERKYRPLLVGEDIGFVCSPIVLNELFFPDQVAARLRNKEYRVRHVGSREQVIENADLLGCSEEILRKHQGSSLEVFSSILNEVNRFYQPDYVFMGPVMSNSLHQYVMVLHASIILGIPFRVHGWKFLNHKFEEN